MRRSLLQIGIDKEKEKGFEVYKTGSGLYSYNKRSNMGKAYRECEEKYPNAEITVVTGARAGQYKNDGYQFAIMYREKTKC